MGYQTLLILMFSILTHCLISTLNLMLLQLHMHFQMHFQLFLSLRPALYENFYPLNLPLLMTRRSRSINLLEVDFCAPSLLLLLLLIYF